MARALTILVIVVLVANLVYFWFFRAPEVVVHDGAAPVDASPVKRLSAFVDANLDKIFCPLDTGQTLLPTQEVREVRQTLLDLRGKAKSDRDRQLYDAGVVLCQEMADAIALRESFNRRLADMRKKGFTSSLADPKNKALEEKKRKDFFESGVMRGWETQAARARERIQQQYAQMRLLER